MPWLTRYLDARPKNSHFIRTKTGRWGLSSKVRAHRFATREEAETAIDDYTAGSGYFFFRMLMGDHYRKHFAIEPVTD